MVLTGKPTTGDDSKVWAYNQTADHMDLVAPAALSGVQPADSDLTALAALSSTGIIARTGSGTAAVRTITGTSNRVTVTNGDGVSGNPTLDVGSTVYTAGGTDVAVADGGTGASSASAARTALGVAVGSDVQAFDADLTALAALAATGVVARTGAGTVSARTITGTSGRLTVTNGDGVAGDPTLDVGSNVYVTGGTDVAVADGGTGASTAAAARTNLDAAQTSHTHAASDVASGTVATARLGSGTASSSTFLRGDQTWVSVAGSGVGFLVVAATDSPTKWKSIADYQCDGTADQTEINSAITAVGSQGGTVQLAPGNYSCTGAVQMRLHVWLRGAGRHASVVFCGAGSAWAAYDASTPGAVIEPVNANQDFFEVSDLYISGAGITKCVYDNSASTTQSGWDSADATHYYHDLFMNFGVSAHMHLASFRGARVEDCKVFSGGSGTAVDGFYFQGIVDSFFTALDAGGASGNGFNLTCVNCRFSQCKSWYSGVNGYYFQSGAVRNQMVSSEAQDNTRNGFLIEGGYNTFNGCQADSNSYDLSGSGSPTGRTYMGFRVSAGPTMIVGSMAYDKNEGSRGARQVYGAQVDAAVTDSVVEVYTSGNFTGGVNLVATFSTTNHIRALGQSVLNRNPGRLVGTATYDPPSLSNAGTATTTVTVTGAAVGDAVIGLGHTSIAAAGWKLDGTVTATNTVTVVLTNVSAGASQNLASGTLTAVVAKST